MVSWRGGAERREPLLGSQSQLPFPHGDKKGLVGIRVGNTSGGDFANFKIVPA